jgi:6-phosphofructokinase 1
MKRIAVLTSGGDAAGMNAAIRAVVRTGLDRGWEVFGVRHGFAGLTAGDFLSLGARDVGGIIQRGGTALWSARCPEFKTEEARREALDQLQRRNISALVVIGGDGSQKGSHAISQMGFPVVGVASTIDNDLYGSEITIGVDTALNIALEAIDRLKVTASSHQRAFLVETMGRDCGYLALMAGIAGGAEAIVIPEVETNPELIAAELRGAYDRGKAHAIVVVAEGAEYNAEKLARYFKEHRERLGFDYDDHTNLYARLRRDRSERRSLRGRQERLARSTFQRGEADGLRRARRLRHHGRRLAPVAHRTQPRIPVALLALRLRSCRISSHPYS